MNFPSRSPRVIVLHENIKWVLLLFCFGFIVSTPKKQMESSLPSRTPYHSLQQGPILGEGESIKMER